MLPPRSVMPLSVASPPTPLPAMTFRLAAVVPPMVLPSDPVRMKMPASALRTAAAAVPVTLVPMKFPTMTLLSPVRSIASAVKPLTTRPRSVEPLPPAWMLNAVPTVPPPRSSITGTPAKSGSLVPLMTTASVMLGSTALKLMVCGPAPAMLKLIVFSPAVLLVAVIASRSEMKPSAPLLASSVEIDVVSPSATSLVVSTTSVLDGLIETPPTAQLSLPLQVHDMLTEAAPAAVLPPPLISGALRSHCSA